MTRYCASCRLHRPLRDFDLGGGQLSSTCLACAHERSRTEDHVARSQRHAKIAALEKDRRALVNALATIDAEIAELRGKAPGSSLTRFCSNCRLHRVLRDFDLAEGQLSSTCRECVHDPDARRQRNAQIASREKERRQLIAALVKIDAEITELRAQPTATSPFTLVEPTDIFDGGDVDALDADLGYND